jgi:hypothetical protein
MHLEAVGEEGEEVSGNCTSGIFKSLPIGF